MGFQPLSFLEKLPADKDDWKDANHQVREEEGWDIPSICFPLASTYLNNQMRSKCRIGEHDKLERKNWAHLSEKLYNPLQRSW